MSIRTIILLSLLIWTYPAEVFGKPECKCSGQWQISSCQGGICMDGRPYGPRGSDAQTHQESSLSSCKSRCEQQIQSLITNLQNNQCSGFPGYNIVIQKSGTFGESGCALLDNTCPPGYRPVFLYGLMGETVTSSCPGTLPPVSTPGPRPSATPAGGGYGQAGHCYWSRTRCLKASKCGASGTACVKPTGRSCFVCPIE